MISSPLTQGRTRLVDKIAREDIINDYQLLYEVDVSNSLNCGSEVYLLECLDTKYRFFYPLTLIGDDSFYAHMQQYDWYYMPWKWEHEETLKILSSEDKILEVGCGEGGFMGKLTQKGFDIVGLELNNSAVKKTRERGLKVYNQLVETYAKRNVEGYDVVCSYQVLEHIAEVYSFITAQIKCLRKGGKLIISVPNNRSFIRHNKFNLLNIPPHHMGHWTEESLLQLSAIFPLRVDKVLFEPLQKYHVNWYLDILEHRFIKNRVIRAVYYRMFLKRMVHFLIDKISPIIRGHSIMVVFEKID